MGRLEVYRCEKCGTLYTAPPKTRSRVCTAIRAGWHDQYEVPMEWTVCNGLIAPFTLGASLIFGHEVDEEAFP